MTPTGGLSLGIHQILENPARTWGAGVYAGSCDDMAVTEEQIAIAQETINHETSARPSARCPS